MNRPLKYDYTLTTVGFASLRVCPLNCCDVLKPTWFLTLAAFVAPPFTDFKLPASSADP